MAKINPYLFFNGNTLEAFNFYKSVFGSEFETLVRLKDMSIDPYAIPESEANQILNIVLPIGKNDVLIGSDIPLANRMPELVTSNRFAISIKAESKEEANKLFEGLLVEGQIEIPIAQRGAYFGIVIDKYDIKWLVNFDNRMPN
jgi:PhnB protein